MAADVEVPGHLLHSEGALDAAPILTIESMLGHLVLFHLVRLTQQFEIPGIQVVTIGIQTELLDGPDVGVMRHHDILQVEGDDLAGEPRELYVQVDSNSIHSIR